MADVNIAEKNETRVDFDAYETDDNIDQTSPKTTMGVPSPSIKRKASPHHKTTVTKRYRNITSKATKTTAKQVSSQKAISFSEMVFITFSEKQFQKDVSPIFQTMLKPVVNESIEELTKSIATLVTANKSLQETVEKQCKLVEEQKTTIDKQFVALKEKDAEIADLKKTVDKLRNEVSSLSTNQNDLEQYSRRNSLRISNLKPDRNLTEKELTSEVVSFINESILKDPATERIETSDVERCHPASKGSNPQILIKFKAYESKRLVYSNKKHLRNNPKKVFVTEDLTFTNHEIIKTLLTLKKGGIIQSFWTLNGKIFVKKGFMSDPTRVKNSDDVARLSE